MADPIARLSCSSASNQCGGEDEVESEVSSSVGVAPSSVPNSSEPLASSSPPEPDTCAASPAVQSLVARYSDAASSTLSRVAAGRAQDPSGLYVSSSPTPDGESWAGEIALANARVGRGVLEGTAIEALGASTKTGADLDLQMFMLRDTLAISGGGFGASITLSGPELRANLGEHNDDGSVGGNIGLGSQLFGVEATLSTPVGSLTYGASASIGASGSLGVRDADHDGAPEFCAKVSVPAYTVGACLEQFW